jgi:hypothetical protein
MLLWGYPRKNAQDPSKLTSGRSYGAISIPTDYPPGWCGAARASSGPMTVARVRAEWRARTLVSRTVTTTARRARRMLRARRSASSTIGRLSGSAAASRALGTLAGVAIVRRKQAPPPKDGAHFNLASSGPPRCACLGYRRAPAPPVRNWGGAASRLRTWCAEAGASQRAFGRNGLVERSSHPLRQYHTLSTCPIGGSEVAFRWREGNQRQIQHAVLRRSGPATPPHLLGLEFGDLL